MIFAILIPASLLAALGYFVLASAAKAEGLLQSFGKYLGLWCIVLAGLFLIGTASAPMFGGRPFGIGSRSGMMGPMHQMMREHMQMRGGAMPDGMPGMANGMRPQPQPAPAPKND